MKTLKLTFSLSLFFLVLAGCKKEVVPSGVCVDQARIDLIASQSDNNLYDLAASNGPGTVYPNPQLRPGSCYLVYIPRSYGNDIEVMAGGGYVGTAHSVVETAALLRQALRQCKCGI